MTAARVPTPDDIRAWPVTVDVPAAGSCWGLGRDVSYDIARRGEFPVPVLKIGRQLRVTRASIQAALGITEEASAAPSKSLANALFPQVQGSASDHRSEAHGSRQAA